MFALCAAAAVAPPAQASPYQAAVRSYVRVVYQNGDSAEVRCDPSTASCVLELVVDGRRFEFDAAALEGHMPLPQAVEISAASVRSRRNDFRFAVSAPCPAGRASEDGTGACTLTAIVQNGLLYPIEWR